MPEDPPPRFEADKPPPPFEYGVGKERGEDGTMGGSGMGGESGTGAGADRVGVPPPAYAPGRG